MIRALGETLHALLQRPLQQQHVHSERALHVAAVAHPFRGATCNARCNATNSTDSIFIELGRFSAGQARWGCSESQRFSRGIENRFKAAPVGSHWASQSGDLRHA
jgi:hypothetical protein